MITLQSLNLLCAVVANLQMSIVFPGTTNIRRTGIVYSQYAQVLFMEFKDFIC